MISLMTNVKNYIQTSPKMADIKWKNIYTKTNTFSFLEDYIYCFAFFLKFTLQLLRLITNILCYDT